MVNNYFVTFRLKLLIVFTTFSYFKNSYRNLLVFNGILGEL